MSQGRKPDYNLAALDKETGVKNNRVGAVWIQPDGRISIQINPWVVLDGNNPNMLLSLFPYQEHGQRKPIETSLAGPDDYDPFES